MKTAKKVKFMYFRPIAVSANESTVCVLDDLIQTIEDKNYDDRSVVVLGVKMRLEKTHRVSQNLLGIQFLRLRETNTPYIVKSGEKAKDLRLDDDEYVGEGVSILYDNQAHVFMLQKNKFSVSSKLIESYLSFFNPDRSFYISLCQLRNNEEIERFIGKKFKKLEFTLSSVPESYMHTRSRHMNEILETSNNVNSLLTKVSFSVGKFKSEILNSESLNEIISGLSETLEYVQSAKANIECDYEDVEDIKTSAEEYDLLNFFAEDTYTFKLQNRKPFELEDALNTMITIYEKRKNQLSIAQFVEAN